MKENVPRHIRSKNGESTHQSKCQFSYIIHHSNPFNVILLDKNGVLQNTYFKKMILHLINWKNIMIMKQI